MKNAIRLTLASLLLLVACTTAVFAEGGGIAPNPPRKPGNVIVQ